MGVVFEAFDRDQQRPVALKVLSSLQPNARLRFKNEFRALAAIAHPNLVNLGELLERDGQLYFSMELVHGVDFLSYVRPQQPSARLAAANANTPSTHTMPSTPSGKSEGRPVGRAVRTGGADLKEDRLRLALEQLVRGVDALHAAGKVHRDLKPSNILVTETGRVVVLDFGLVTEAGQDRITDAGHIVGTASYMAPEQVEHPDVGPEADWYSVGAILYEALTGRRAYPGTAQEILEAKRSGPPVRPSQVAEDVPPDLDQLCVELMRFDADGRPDGRAIMGRLGRASARRREPRDSGRSFVGRAGELTELHGALKDASEQAAVVCLLHGPSGIGKTALSHQFAAEVAARPEARVLTGRCYQRESVAYKAVDELVDELARQLSNADPALLDRVIPPDAHLLTQVFPVLRRVPNLSGPRDRRHDLRDR